jgi:hypothetical protein
MRLDAYHSFRVTVLSITVPNGGFSYLLPIFSKNLAFPLFLTTTQATRGLDKQTAINKDFSSLEPEAFHLPVVRLDQFK